MTAVLATRAPGRSLTPAMATRRLTLRRAGRAAQRLAAEATRAAVDELAAQHRTAVAARGAALADVGTLARHSAVEVARLAGRVLDAPTPTSGEVGDLVAAIEVAGVVVPAPVMAWEAALRAAEQAGTALLAGYPALRAADRRHLLELIDISASIVDEQEARAAVARYRLAIEQGADPATADERYLAELVVRAADPDAPDAATTGPGGANWAVDGVRLDAAALAALPTRRRLTLARGPLAMALGGLAESGTDSQSPQRVRANWTLRTVGAQVRFHQRVGDQLRLLGTPLTGRLRTLLSLVELGPLPTDTLVVALAQRLDNTPASTGPALDHDPAAATVAAATVAAAVQQELLVADAGLDERSPHLLRRTADALTGRHPDLATTLTALDAALATNDAGEVSRRLPAAQAGLAALGRYPVRLPVHAQDLLAPVAVGTDGYRRAIEDLGSVAALIGLFDRLHEARALLLAAVVERFGVAARIPLLEHAADLMTMVGRRALLLTPGNSDEFGPADGSLTELLSARATARTALRKAGSPADYCAVGDAVRLDAAALVALADGLPDRMSRPPAGYTLAVRPLGGQLWLDDVWPGTPQPHRTGLTVVEDSGSTAFGADDAQPLTVAEFGPLEWLGAVLEHDPDRDELRLLHPDGYPVQVVSAAMAYPDRLPPPLKLAYWLHGTSRVELDPLQLRTSRRAVGETVGTPRVYAGDVVLQRTRWYPGIDLSSLDLAQLTRWRVEHGVPATARAVSPMATDPIPGYPGQGRPARAPRSVDFGGTLLADGRLDPGGYLTEEVPAGDGPAVQWLIEYDRDGIAPDTGPAR